VSDGAEPGVPVTPGSGLSLVITPGSGGRLFFGTRTEALTALPAGDALALLVAAGDGLTVFKGPHPADSAATSISATAASGIDFVGWLSAISVLSCACQSI